MAAQKTISEQEKQRKENVAWDMVEETRKKPHNLGVAADCWFKWIERDSPSWKRFIAWLIEAEIDPANTWDFFARYGNDYFCFGQEWIADEEREDFMAHCGDVGTPKASE